MIKSSLKFITASEYCESVFDGTHDTPKPTASGFKLLTSKHILNNKLDVENAYYISEEDYKAINKRSQVSQWDVLFSMIGTVGTLCLVSQKDIDFAIKNIGVFSCKDEAKARFLYYYLSSPYSKKIIENYLNGAVQKFLSLEMLRNFPVPEFNEEYLPMIDLLSSLDKKIECNNQLISALESLAKTIYGYWFLQFEFPNEEGKPYKSSGGKMIWSEELRREIPEGWEIMTINSLSKRVKVGFVGPIDKYYCSSNEGFPIIRPAEMSEDGIMYNKLRHITTEFYEKNKKSQLHKGDIIISRCGKDGIPNIYELDTNAQVLNAVVIEVNDNISSNIFINETLKSPYIQKQISNYTSGSVQGVINTEMIAALKLPFDALICKKYTNMCSSIYTKITLLRQEIRELTELRDYLLPMLMNGQVGFIEVKK